MTRRAGLPAPTLTEEQVKRAYSALKDEVPWKDIANRFGLSKGKLQQLVYAYRDREKANDSDTFNRINGTSRCDLLPSQDAAN